MFQERSDAQHEREAELDPTWEDDEDRCNQADQRLDELPPILSDFNNMMEGVSRGT